MNLATSLVPCSSSAPMQQASSPGARPLDWCCTKSPRQGGTRQALNPPAVSGHDPSAYQACPSLNHQQLSSPAPKQQTWPCRRWETRYFQLQGSTLQYFRSKKDIKGPPRGHVDLRVGNLLSFLSRECTQSAASCCRFSKACADSAVLASSADPAICPPQSCAPSASWPVSGCQPSPLIWMT